MAKKIPQKVRRKPKPVRPLTVDRRSASRLLADAPEAVRTFVETEKIPVRDVVENVYGRNSEVERLAGYVQRTANEKRPGKALPGITVMAAPGAGKTVLVRHLQKELQQRGIGVVQITPEQLTSADGLKNAILATDPWQKQENRNKALKKLGSMTAKVGDVAANTTVTLTYGALGMVVP